MVRERPIRGTRYFAGTILEKDGHIGRHLAVTFQCAHCKNGIGRAKFSCLKASAEKRFQTKSCGCLERECFERYHQTKASSFQTIEARRIFESYALDGAKKTAKRFDLSIYLANAVWQRWCRRLERKPEEHREEVFATAQMSMTAAMSLFGYDKGEVLRICWHWRKGLAARAEEAEIGQAAMATLIAEATLLFELHAPIGSWSGSLYEDVKLYINWAITNANERGFELGRYPGELTRKEFATKKNRSDYKWVYNALRVMQPRHLKACFGDEGASFLRTCKLSLKGRIQRRRDFMSRLIIIQPPIPRKDRTKAGTVRNLKWYLPEPTLEPYMISKLFTHYSSLLQQA